MKSKLIKITCTFVFLYLVMATFTYMPVNAVIQDATPKSVINNFGKDPKTAHNFTWETSTSIKTGVIEYCPENQFNGFDKGNILKVTAKSYETQTDLDKRMIHKVELIKLKPGTEYIYRAGNSIGGFSSQGVFKTAEQDLSKFTFVNITDTQGASAKDYSKWENTLDKALQKFPDTRFLVHTGDMVDDGQKINQWDMFTNAVKNEFMNIPIASAVGNHDALNKNKTNTNFKNFTDRFCIPKELDTGAPDGTVYSFDYGNVHIAVMNTECGSKNLKKQGEWLKRDLSKTDKTWKVVALHRGPYGSTYDTSDIRAVWGPIFDEYKVDLVLQGHDHNYMRSYPMKNKTKVKSGEGTVYLCSDTGGVKFYPLKSRSWQAVDVQPRTQMYLAIIIDNRKMEIKAYDIKGILQDSTVLEK